MTKHDTAKPDSPDLSVVIVATVSNGTICKTIEHLCAQTVRDQLEIIIVAQSTTIPKLNPSTTASFFSFQIVEVDAVLPIEWALAVGIRQSHAPSVALVEDHAYPAPNWAEVLIDLYQEHWSVVGTTIANANPQNMLSQATFLLGYGFWIDMIRSGEVDDLPGHNVSYRRDVLMAYDAVLENELERESGVHKDLKAKGHRFYLAADTKIYHINPSLLSSVVTLRLILGRLYGATRAKREHWSLFRRLLYIGGAPLIPFVRLRRILPELFEAGQHNDLLPHILPGILVNLIADAAGQALGYAFGQGQSLQRYQEFEVDRLRHVNGQDKQTFTFEADHVQQRMNRNDN